MTQSAAIFLDAYRELHARRMFWITLLLSGLVVCTLLIIGLGQNHELKILAWELPIPLPSTLTLADLLKGTFVNVGISFWLTWAATILALISTASIIPDFISSGSIDLVLAKPIGRLRLFMLKYLSGLLFVTLQVSVFSMTAFLIIGLRADSWEPGLFIAIPLTVAFFSYLFAVCVLVGLVTRSAIAALLLTILFWMLLFAVNITDELMMMPRALNEEYVDKLHIKLADPSSSARRATIQEELDEATQSLKSWQKWHGLVVTAKTVLPKTSETVKLLERSLIDLADLPSVDEEEGRAALPFMTSKMQAAGVRANDVILRIERIYRNRSPWWIVGTSLAFEAGILAIAAWQFCRKDF